MEQCSVLSTYSVCQAAAQQCEEDDAGVAPLPMDILFPLCAVAWVPKDKNQNCWAGGRIKDGYSFWPLWYVPGWWQVLGNPFSFRSGFWTLSLVFAVQLIGLLIAMPVRLFFVQSLGLLFPTTATGFWTFKSAEINVNLGDKTICQLTNLDVTGTES